MSKYKFRVGLLVCLILTISTLAVYWQVRDFDFVNFDDSLYVLNHYVRDGLTVKGILWAFKLEGIDYWRPITWLSHMLDCHLYGLNAGMHHAVNLIIHIVTGILLFNVLKRMTGTLWRSAFVAALFLLHPLNVESVAWVAERKNVLSTFFWMATMFAYTGYARRPGAGKYLAILLVFSMGLMTKPTLVTLPFVLILLDFWPLCRFSLGQAGCRYNPGTEDESFQKASLFRLVIEKIPMIVLAVVLASLTLFSAPQEITLGTVSINLRITNALVSYLWYIGKMIWPANLAVFYPFPEAVPIWKAVGAGFVLLCITVQVFRTARQRPYFFVGWMWYMGTLVPAIGLVWSGLWPAVADRFVYIPLIGLFIMISWGGTDVARVRRYGKAVAAVVAAAILLSCVAVSRAQTEHWKNRITLFRHALKVTENNCVAHNNLAIAMLEKGKRDEAVFHFKEILKKCPEDSQNLYNMGLAMQNAGNVDQAIFYYREALKINPEDEQVHNNLANVLFSQGNIDESGLHYSEALRIKPEFSEAHNNLANVLAAQGRIREAVVHYNEALSINPENRDAHYNLGSLLLSQKQYKEAAAHFAATIKIDPTYAKAYNKIGILLTRQGKFEKAGVFFSRALELDSGYVEARENLKVIKQEDS